MQHPDRNRAYYALRKLKYRVIDSPRFKSIHYNWHKQQMTTGNTHNTPFSPHGNQCTFFVFL